MNEPLFLGMRAAIDLLKAQAAYDLKKAKTASTLEDEILNRSAVGFNQSANFLSNKLEAFEGNESKDRQELAFMRGIITAIQEGLVWSTFGGSDTEITQRFEKALKEFVKAVPEMTQ